MKNKIVAILAATAALSSSLFAVPAQAVQQDVSVEVTVSPVLYLRTFKNISLQITNADFGAADKDYNPITETTDGSTKINSEAPASLGLPDPKAVPKTVSELFAVWSNASKVPTINLKLTQPKLTLDGGTRTVMISAATPVLPATPAVPTLSRPLIGGANLTFDFTTFTAGLYKGGTITVEALPTF
ncbi:hypothetical protein NUACC21_48950 [Scytonema sp. NUACC21]